jgi:hypothetical protein
MHRLYRIIFICFLLRVSVLSLNAQKVAAGTVTGNILDKQTGKPVADATVSLISQGGPAGGQSMASTPEGAFAFNNLAYGYYRLRISAIGYNNLTIDSIHVRAGRSDFSLNDLRLVQKSSDMDAVIVYAEKPLVQSKGGNLTFNAAESPLSEGSSANELLRNVPLVATDANGNLVVRGKTPIVLIDDKPINLNAQQLQDFLDALPGNMIEKIEVMTNPPPEYANEDGGVINIVTRKGKIGLGGRVSVYGGTRGEYGGNTNVSYRDHKLALNLSVGEGYNRFAGNGYSNRENIYTDSTDMLNTKNSYINKNTRPNGRFSLDYDFDKFNTISAVAQVNHNNYRDYSLEDYASISQYGDPYGLSNRSTQDNGYACTPNGNLSFRHTGKLPEEVLTITASGNYTRDWENQSFYQQYLNPDATFSGSDSSQHLHGDSRIHGYELRFSYDKPLDKGARTLLSLGGYYNSSSNDVLQVTSALDKADNTWVADDSLSSNLNFLETKTNFRASLRRTIAHGLTISAGTSVNRTLMRFDLYNMDSTTRNAYWNWLPFANINKTWDNQWSLTLVYRRTISRPGLDQMNPTIDYSDPYNLKYGNPKLMPSLSHQFDLHTGKSNNNYYFNYSVGLNLVQDVYSQITTLEPGGVTITTYENISSRTEYSTGTWSGYTFSPALKANIGLNYIYSHYSEYDRTVNDYQDNGSFYTNVNLSYTPTRLWNFNISCLYNRNGSPQGVSTATVNTNLSIQRKFWQKKLIVTLNVTDPFIEQSTTATIRGTDFYQQTYSTTQTRNYRLTLSYNWNSSIERGRKQLLRAAQKKLN